MDKEKEEEQKASKLEEKEKAKYYDETTRATEWAANENAKSKNEENDQVTTLVFFPHEKIIEE